MKKLAMNGTLALYLITLSAFAGNEGGGGDPFEVIATQFPDKMKLELSIKTVKEKVRSSALADEIKKSVVSELDELKSKNRFMFLENILILSQDDFDGYEMPVDAGRFLGLGAMTGKNKGDIIYFSARSLLHEQKYFDELLLHEVLHHIVPNALSGDEKFVDALAKSIFEGEVSERQNTEIRLGLSPRKGHISSEQILNAFLTFFDVGKFCLSRATGLFDRNVSDEEAERCKKMPETVASYYRNNGDMPKNVANMSVSSFINSTAQAAGIMSSNSSIPVGKQRMIGFLKHLSGAFGAQQCFGRSCTMEDLLVLK
jgi:hypothetical protein